MAISQIGKVGLCSPSQVNTVALFHQERGSKSALIMAAHVSGWPLFRICPDTVDVSKMRAPQRRLKPSPMPLGNSIFITWPLLLRWEMQRMPLLLKRPFIGDMH